VVQGSTDTEGGASVKQQYTMPVPPRGFPIPPKWLNEVINMAATCDERDALRNPSFFERQGLHPQLARVQFAAIRQWAQSGLRTVFPVSEVIEACVRTDALDGISMSDLRVPYPAFAFYFPASPKMPGSYRIIVCATNANTFGGVQITAAASGDGLTAVPMADDGWMGAGLYDLGSREPLVKDGRGQGLPGLPSLTDTEHQHTTGVLNLMTCMILLMQTYPTYIHDFGTRHRVNGRVAFHNHVRIGFPDSLARAIRVGVSRSGRNTTGSKAAHWRRGHWRRQPHGNRWAMEHPDIQPVIDHRGRTCHMDWIMPVLVTGNQEVAA
jgi:hypothetical protein